MKEKYLKHIYLISVLLLFLPLSAYCNRVPDIIGEFTQIPHFVSCIGDQNGDGRADLILPNIDEHGLDIFYGRFGMGDQCDVFIPFRRDESEEVWDVGWVGNISDNHQNTFAAWGLIRENMNLFTDFYSEIDNDNSDPWESWGPVIRDEGWRCFQNKPFDFNGDGFDDFICCRGYRDSTGYLNIYYGGNDFDSIPDWIETFEGHSYVFNFKFSCGYDVNADGYDDIFVNGQADFEGYNQREFYAIYLGGAEPDTNPAVLFWDRQFEGVQFPIIMTYGFSLLKDINDDGYDDFGVYYKDSFSIPEQEIHYWWDGIYVFFGSEELDSEPDLIMQGAQLGEAGIGDLVGGDFNGDGIGDICANYNASAPGNNEIQFHFGQSNIDTIPDLVFSGNDYNNRIQYLGTPSSVADYSGDGIDDVVVTCTGGETKLVVLAGDRNWYAGVEPEPELQPADFEVSLAPNPFNNLLRIEYRIQKAGHYSLKIFDIGGREVNTIVSRALTSGVFTTSWQSQHAGIYFVELISRDGSRIVQKAVCLP